MLSLGGEQEGIFLGPEHPAECKSGNKLPRQHVFNK